MKLKYNYMYCVISYSGVVLEYLTLSNSAWTILCIVL